MQNTINLNRKEFLDSLFDECKDKENWDPTQELFDKILFYDRKGYSYITKTDEDLNVGSLCPYVISPSGTKLTLSKINRILRKIIVGDPNQTEAIGAWEYYMANDIYDNGF